jgi:hypothetical protein
MNNTPNTWLNIMQNTSTVCKNVTKKQYQQWRKAVVFDCCRGLTQGQSFCEYFNIRDNLLLYNVIHDTAIDSYIRDTYLETKFLAH